MRLAADIKNAERKEFEKIKMQEYKRMRLEGSRGRAVPAWSHRKYLRPQGQQECVEKPGAFRGKPEQQKGDGGVCSLVI